jgi:hypothetical protein
MVRNTLFEMDDIVRGLLEKYPTFGREKETGLPGMLMADRSVARSPPMCGRL